MGYIGNTPADKFLTLAKQSFSTSATTSYTLDSAVSSTQDIALFINNVRQSPVDAYSVSGTALTLTSATAGTDEMYCVYLGKTVGTVSPASDSVTTAMIQSNAVNNAKMADDAIGLAELSATGTPSSSNFLRGDNSWATAGGDNTPYFHVYKSGNQTISNGSFTTVTFDTEQYDSANAFASNTFTAPSSGYYFIYSQLVWDGQTNSDYSLNRLMKNGSPINWNAFFQTYSSGGFGGRVISLSASDTVLVQCYQESGGNLDLRGSTEDECQFGGYKLIT